ncbi:hypothetical protein [Psychroflexus sp. ALD_RP9]|uniref:hypothetical protein n=2 Tax=Psychroflexus sp. ALD_RP9 TaxID=2777186 RepID=UPI001A8D970D|nr:hypothetical protein [Psychroflexus sp. ALD_RP9]QSS96240.1 hypothetical protein IMZ30_07170 [Psychroflexus sp. ALD_RP9]QSS96884.1 hypothetical protein IMZ30_10600 [Psychroflexus sp. ALD_RP9]
MRHTYKYALLMMMVLVAVQLNAQALEDAIGFEDTVSDTPAAPIHFLIPLAIAVGAFLGIKKLKK